MLATPLDLLSFAFVPFTGVLVRHRASYHPKPAPNTLDSPDVNVEEKGAAPTNSDLPSPVERGPGMLEIWRRVSAKEGKSGLWKGIFPTFLWNIVLPIFWFFRCSTKVYISPAPATLDRSLLSALFYNSFSFISWVFIYRSIMTNEKLGVLGTSVTSAMHALFTEHERKKPWVLWFTPGLIPALVTNILLQVQVFRPLRSLLNHTDIFAVQVAGIVSLLILSTAVLAPLDVIVTRLVLQRNYGPLAQEGSIKNPDVEAQVVNEKSHPVPLDVQPEAEVVVRTRNEPYLGLSDCFKKIVQEEGWTVLYRGWWLTLLGNFMTMIR